MNRQAKRYATIVACPSGRLTRCMKNIYLPAIIIAALLLSCSKNPTSPKEESHSRILGKVIYPVGAEITHEDISVRLVIWEGDSTYSEAESTGILSSGTYLFNISEEGEYSIIAIAPELFGFFDKDSNGTFSSNDTISITGERIVPNLDFYTKITSDSLYPIQEVEENDDFSSAQELSIATNYRLSGNLASGGYTDSYTGDIDIFHFLSPEEIRITFTLSWMGVADLDIYLFDSEGEFPVAQSNNVSQTSPERFSYETIPQEEYYIVVASADSAAGYQLLLEVD